MPLIILTLIKLAPKIAWEGISYKRGIRAGAFQGMVPGGAEGGTQTPPVPLPSRKISLHPIHKEQMFELQFGHPKKRNFLGFRRKELEIFPLFQFSPHDLP